MMKKLLNKQVNRKYFILFTLITLMSLTTACEEKVFNFVLNIDEIYGFDVFDDGVFSEDTEVSRASILEDIDIDSDAEIEAVNIESFAVKIAKAVGNEASAVSINGFIYLDGDVSKTPITVFQNLVIDGDAASNFISITDLNAAGVNALAGKLLDYINKTDNDNFVVQITGTSIPDGSRIAASVELKMRATVKFKENLEVPYFMGND